ncbi:MAG TPA: DUF3037 domain-containing protein [Bacteroidetes bacterium]|nr:DUF3037 domain-containing protein [Bacteroidota bacterium]
MKKIACQYAIVRFAPFVETGEFANVGIVMMAQDSRYFGFELELKRYARITHFFEDVDARLYKKALYNVREELERIGDLLKAHGFDRRLKENDVDFAQRLFAELVRPRETIIRFGQVRTALADDPEKKLKELFAFYVERNFVTKKYQEELLLESGVRKLLYRIHVGDLFEKARVGDDTYHVNFPFVRAEKGRLVKIIKPLHLAHPEPTRIYEHGDAWIRRINRLKGKYLEPDRVLFTLAGPDEDGNRLKAYSDIEQELQTIGVKTVPYANQDEIERFALN